jgi:Superfamily II RNA helicase
MNANSSIERRRFFAQRVPLYRKDPVLFAREVCNFEPDEWQQEALMDLAKNPKVAVKSGQGVGKTGMEAEAGVWFLSCFPDARVVATAPTKQQLHDVLWSEIAKWQERSPLLKEILKWTKTYIFMKGYEKRWFATARTATKPENMQGFHEDNMLFIVDEGSGVADPIMEAILGTLSGANNKLLICGNPTKTTGAFYDAFHSSRWMYKCHTVSSLDSDRTNKDNIQSLIKKYGWDSNVVRVRVRGLFPLQEDDVFMILSWIEGSISTEMTSNTQKAFGVYETLDGKRITDVTKAKIIDIGCDVARYGNDKTCIGYKVNEVVKFYKKINGKDTTWTAGNIAALYRELKTKYQFKGVIPVKIDDGGVGGGVVDQLKAMKRAEPEVYADMMIVPVNFGQPVKHVHYYDTTTYMMGIVRESIQPFDELGNPKEPDIILPDDEDLIGQLSSRKFAYAGSKQKVESKKEMKERGLPSPDEADCILLVCLPVNTRKRGENN